MHNDYQAILFDFDGVIGQTHEDNYAAWINVFKRYNAHIDREQYLCLEGMRSVDMIPIFLKQNRLDSALCAEIISQKNDYYAEQNKFSFYPGIRELLAWLRTTAVKIAVVSGGSAERLLQPPSNEILPLVDLAITSVDYQRCKPDPQPYIVAAQKLNLAPQRCMVIENAPLGIKAAKAAGMDCIALTHTLAAKHLREADLVLGDIPGLRTWLEKQLSK